MTCAAPSDSAGLSAEAPDRDTSGL